MIAGVGPGRADHQRHPAAIHHQGMLGALPAAIHGAGAGRLTAEGTHGDPIDDHRLGIELAGSLQRRQQVGVEAIPDASLLPGAQAAVGGPAGAAQFGRDILQLGFDLAFDELRARANTYGMAAFAQANSYTGGELGYYTRRLADTGLVALAASNGLAFMTVGEGREPAYGTNPLSFAAPVEGGPPLVINQASSATAFVNIRRAAEEGREIPEGWAADRHGHPTTDASEAIGGMLLAFGGARGANIALMAEVLAAGLTGANWSLDAPSFSTGEESPGVGLFIFALKPDLLAPDFPTRLASQLERLAARGVHIPGRNRAPGEIELSESLVASIERREGT